MAHQRQYRLQIITTHITIIITINITCKVSETVQQTMLIHPTKIQATQEVMRSQMGNFSVVHQAAHTIVTWVQIQQINSSHSQL